MRAAAVFCRLRVVAATTPASRKFHGTMRSARRSRRDCALGLATARTAPRGPRWSAAWSRRRPRARRTNSSPSSTAVPANTSSPRPALHGQGLAGEGGLVDRRAPALHHAVDAYGHAGAHRHHVADTQRRSRHGPFAVALHQLHRLGCGQERVHQLAFGAGAGCSFRAFPPDPEGTWWTLPSWGRAGRRTCRWPRRRGPARPAARGPRRAQRRGKEAPAAPRRPDGAHGRGQKPPARQKRARKRGHVHDQRLRARGRRRAPVAARRLHGLRVDGRQALQHAPTPALPAGVAHRKRPDARIHGALQRVPRRRAPRSKGASTSAGGTGPASSTRRRPGSSLAMRNSMARYFAALPEAFLAPFSEGAPVAGAACAPPATAASAVLHRRRGLHALRVLGRRRGLLREVEVVRLRHDVVHLGLRLFDDVLVCALGLQALRHSLHVALLGRGAGERLHPHRPQQETGSHQQTAPRPCLHAYRLSARAAARAVRERRRALSQAAAPFHPSFPKHVA